MIRVCLPDVKKNAKPFVLVVPQLEESSPGSGGDNFGEWNRLYVHIHVHVHKAGDCVCAHAQHWIMEC